MRILRYCFCKWIGTLLHLKLQSMYHIIFSKNFYYNKEFLAECINATLPLDRLPLYAVLCCTYIGSVSYETCGLHSVEVQDSGLSSYVCI
jgi:hypothetical protein